MHLPSPRHLHLRLLTSKPPEISSTWPAPAAVQALYMPHILDCKPYLSPFTVLTCLSSPSLPETVGLWTNTLSNIGISISPDAYNGDASGAYVATSTINPANWTRSYSKSAYIDPFYRPNLHILTDSQVTRVIFSGTKATAIEYGQDKSTVNVVKEAIISAGPIGSPSTLMRSGVGPQDVLNAAGVSVGR